MPSTKQLVIAGGIGVAVWFFFFRKHAPGGTAFFTELNMVNCKCMSTEFFKDGTTKSTQVDLTRCQADADLKPTVEQCIDNIGDLNAQFPAGAGLDGS